MKVLSLSALSAATLAALVAAANQAGAGTSSLDAASAAQLEALRRSPDAAGSRVYRGTVVPLNEPLKEPMQPPLFSYERRVSDTADGLSAAHITQDRDGRVIIVERANVAPDYSLQGFDAINAQLGISGSVRLSGDGKQLEYQLLDNGKTSHAVEEVAHPVVSGPSLHGFIRHRWLELAAGQAIEVRMIVLAKKQTYGFEIRMAEQRDGQTSFRITPSHWLTRLAIAPLTVVFDSATKNVLRYEGRVPPLRDDFGKLATLDARVDYTLHAAQYR
jgi:hypothetical protein